MGETLAVRQELHRFIDDIPERNLNLLRPLLSYFADEPLVIETDLTDEEKIIIAEGRKLYREHPEEFVPLESVL